VIGMPSRSMPAAAVMKVKNVRFDPVKFNWIGSPEVNHLVLFINNASAVKKPADLFKHELIVGATGLAQGITVGPSILKNVLGMKLKIVTGYRSPGDMALAASRKEIEAFANTIGGAAGARRPWVESGQMRVLFNFEPEPVPGLGLPTVFEFVKTDEQRKILTFFASNVLLGRPIMAPPGVPADRVNLLRRAFEATMKDPALLKEAKVMSFEIALQSGEQIAKLVADIASTSPDTISRAQRASRPD
jgi:tripartite-type tricarboxylate transporter receptor subunit TctC